MRLGDAGEGVETTRARQLPLLALLRGWLPLRLWLPRLRRMLLKWRLPCKAMTKSCARLPCFKLPTHLPTSQTDLERETILADRFDRKVRRDEAKTVRAQMQQARMAAKQQEKRSSKRGTSSAQDEKKAKLAALAAAREKKSSAAQRRREEERRREEDSDGHEDDGGLVDDAGSEEGEMFDEGARRREDKARRADDAAAAAAEAAEAAAPKEGPAPFNNLERVRLTRQKLEKWINEPFFESVVPGCFVRIGIGTHEGRPMYRVAEIVGVKDGFRKYSIEKIETTKRIELQIGASKRYFQINYVSNTNFEMPELEKYGRIMKQASLPTKTLTEVDKKVKELIKSKNYEYSEEQVGAMVEKNQKTHKMKGNLALRKIQLKRDWDAARETRIRQQQAIATGEGLADGEEQVTQEAVDKLENEYKGMDGKQEVEKRIEQTRESGSFRINDINNRNSNFQREIEQIVGMQKLKDEVEVSAGRKTISDPFARLPIKPIIYWDVKSKAQQQKEAEEEAAAAKAADEAAAEKKKQQEAALTVSTDAASTSASGGIDLVSPGFQALVQTPRAAAAGEEDDGLGDVATGGAEEAEAEGAMPKLAGKRAEAHDIDIDIDIPIKEEQSLQATVAPARSRPVYGSGAAMRPSASSGSGGAPSGQRLSLKDYKKRIDEGG